MWDRICGPHKLYICVLCFFQAVDDNAAALTPVHELHSLMVWDGSTWPQQGQKPIT